MGIGGQFLPLHETFCRHMPASGLCHAAERFIQLQRHLRRQTTRQTLARQPHQVTDRRDPEALQSALAKATPAGHKAVQKAQSMVK